MKQIRADTRKTTQMETRQHKTPSDDEQLDDEQHKWNKVHRGLMATSGEVLKHPMADMLLEFSMQGCPVNTGPKWTKEMLNAALAKGAHPSAMEPAASGQLQNEPLSWHREMTLKMTHRRT